MKTILKLVVIGVLAGLAYKYLTENHINVKAKVDHYIAIISSFIEDAQKGDKKSTAEDSQISEDHNNPSVNNYYNPNTIKEAPNESIITEDVTDAVEFPIPQKALPNMKFNELDKYAFNVPEQYASSLESLVSFLIKPAGNEIEKTRLIFSWIAKNVSYDDNGYNTGYYGDLSATGVFRSRHAVCEGFSELFKTMGTMAGLEVVKISGYAKGYGYSPGYSFSSTNHAWNAVKIDGHWQLFDVTWGSGFGTAVDGRLLSTKQFEDFWFNTDPYAFIFSHLPDNEQWQLVESSITKTEYENLPYVFAAYFIMGFDGRTCFGQAMSGSLSQFPEAYSVQTRIKALSLPNNGILQDGKAMKFILRSSDAKEVAVVNNGKWIRFKKQGDEFTAAFRPVRGTLGLYSKVNDGIEFSGLLSYQVR